MAVSEVCAAFVDRLAGPAFIADAAAPGMPVLCANHAFQAQTGWREGASDRPLATVLKYDGTEHASFERLIGKGQSFDLATPGLVLDGERCTLHLTPLVGEPGQLWFGLVIPANRSEGIAVSQLRHGYQNVIQTMTSLVSLHGRHAQSSATTDAMRALSARFEALAGLYAHAGTGPADSVVLGDYLRGLAGRICAIYDPGHARPFSLRSDDVAVPRRSAAVVGQLFGELLIAAYAAPSEEGLPLLADLARSGGDATLTLISEQRPDHDHARGTLGPTLMRVLSRGLQASIDDEVIDRGRRWHVRWPIDPRPLDAL